MTPKEYDIADTIELSTIFTTKNTLGKIDAGSTQLSVQDASGYSGTDPIIVYGAGTIGGNLSTTVVSVTGNVITLATTAKTSVHRARVGKLTAPGAVTCTVKLPDGTTSTPTPTNPSTGVYVAAFDPTVKGLHTYRFEGTASAKGAEEREFVVREKRA